MTDSISEMAKYTLTRTHRTKEEGIVQVKTTRCKPFFTQKKAYLTEN